MTTTSFQAVDQSEKTLVTNVTGTFLLAITSLPALRQSGLRRDICPRMVLVSSQGHEAAAFAEGKAHDVSSDLNDASKTGMADRIQNGTIISHLFSAERLVESPKDAPDGQNVFAFAITRLDIPVR
ncbi:short-chain dehydrogenase like [Fusarium napiforme]|uniref:Short-chain dehydrogenase like n=1 Tax=Fusarium napiforme TaxID=42672 RepID=A0A8H5J2U1_9HYPO|nr:short-chain dehydrogenase like [Fusarium napiforme]